jgi:hypothetical protein
MQVDVFELGDTSEKYGNVHIFLNTVPLKGNVTPHSCLSFSPAPFSSSTLPLPPTRPLSSHHSTSSLQVYLPAVYQSMTPESWIIRFRSLTGLQKVKTPHVNRLRR